MHMCLYTRPSHFSVCNIEKLGDPGGEAENLVGHFL